jgi:peptidyl-prolyl cis-trans isomerase D
VRGLRLGLPDAEVARRITEDPSFRGALGQFDRARFEQLIRAAGYTEPRFVAEQRQVLLRRQIAEALGGQIAVPKTIIEAMQRYEGEDRSIEYVVLDRTKAGEIPEPTPEALASYFEERKSLFRAPEFRKLVALTVSPAESARWITVSDEEAQQVYQQQRSRFGTPERRQIQQVVLPNMEEARTAFDRIKEGRITLEGLASEKGLKSTDIDLGLLSKNEVLDPAVAEAAFALKEGETSEPIEGRFGAALIRVTKVEPSQQRSFEQVAPQIKQDLALERGRAEMLTFHDKIEDELAAGSQLTEVAQKLGLQPQIVEAVDRSGRDAEGNPVTGLPAGTDIISSVFSSAVGVENEPVQLPGGGYLWYEVTGITPSRERSLDEVKDKAELQWRNEQVAERLQAKATALVDRLNSGSSLADAATAEGLKVETASGLKRSKPSGPLTADLIENVFRTEKGKAASGPGQDPVERVVFRVTEINVPAPNSAAADLKRTEEALQRSYADDVMTQYITRLQSDLGVSINQSALRQVVGGEAN